jgi:DNA-binding MarR family transcriptional regulator
MATRPDVPGPKTAKKSRTRNTALTSYETAVAGYTAAGADETVQRVVTALARVTKRLDVFYRDQLADLGLQRGDWGVLQKLAIETDDGCSSPSRLADVTGVSPSTMTHRLDLLAERGLIERAVDPDNRTRSKVRLTKSGRELFRRAVLEADVVESEVLGPLEAAEQRQLADLLERLLAGFAGSSE